MKGLKSVVKSIGTYVGWFILLWLIIIAVAFAIVSVKYLVLIT